MIHLPNQKPDNACAQDGGDGPNSLVEDLVCGDAVVDPQAWWGWAASHHRILLCVLAGVVVLRLAWCAAHLAAVWRGSRDGTWWEITPPVTATPAATLALWRLLAALLPKPRPWTLVPARLAWEVHATPEGARCGLWVPPDVSSTGVRQAVRRAWPGTRLQQTQAPQLPTRNPVSVLRLAHGGPAWAPLVDADVADPRRGGADIDVARAVHDAVAAAGRGGFGLLQILITRAPASHVAALRRAGRDPARARHIQPEARLASLLLRGVAGAVRLTLDLFTPGAHTGSGHSQQPPQRLRRDPHLAEEARQARVRAEQGPLFVAAVRAAAAAPTRSQARAAADDITAGYAWHGPHFQRRRLPLARRAIQSRWALTAHMRLATAAETVALARVPHEPSLYGLPAAAARRRAPAFGAWAAATAPADLL